MSKIYIMTDMEGVSGIGTMAMMDRDGSEFQRCRRLLDGDVNAAVAGAFDGGATEVVVVDAHGGGGNFIIEELDPRAVYERSCGARNWMPSLDDSFAGLFQVGCHAMAGTLNAFLDHTQSSRSWFRFWLGGREMGEMGQVAAIAGHFGVPTLLVTGDEAACAEAREFFPGIETVAVKQGRGRNHATCLHPERAQQLIREAAARAVKLVGKLKPFVVDMPAEVKLTVTRADYVDGLAGRPGVERLDARTVSKSIDCVLDLLAF